MPWPVQPSPTPAVLYAQQTRVYLTAQFSHEWYRYGNFSQVYCLFSFLHSLAISLRE
jgi:hypothetical protein